MDVDKLPPTPTPSPNPILKWIGSGIGIVGVAVVAYLIFRPTPKPVPDNRHTNTEIVTLSAYNRAVVKLKSPETAQEGLSELETLSQNNNYDATYLLSRLSFDAKNKKEYDNVPDSIWVLQLTSKVNVDYQKAHKLLEKAVSINPNDCNSLYALGFDYLVGDRVTYQGRNLAEAKKCLDKALQLATNSANQTIVKAVEKLYEEYPELIRK